MQIPDVNTGGNNVAALALTFIHQFGKNAANVVQKQVEACADQPHVAERWREVADAIGTLVAANLHMEIALDLLDSVGETKVPASLDHAIVALGIRVSEEQNPEDTMAGRVSPVLQAQAEQRPLIDIYSSFSQHYDELQNLTYKAFSDIRQ